MRIKKKTYFEESRVDLGTPLLEVVEEEDGDGEEHDEGDCDHNQEPSVDHGHRHQPLGSAILT